MKLVIVGTGQGGSNIADEFAALGEWVWKNRRVRISTGSEHDPAYRGIFAVNLGAGDLYGLQNIPQTDDHTILLGPTDEFRGRGAGKVNADGAEQARRNAKKITGTIRDHGDVYSSDAILVIGTTAGGTGSGSIGVIVDLLKEEFKKPVYAMLVLPFENQYDEPDSVINTATCLKKVLDNSKSDAVILVDNQKFVRKSESMGVNYSLINRRIADSFLDILCVGEETDRRFIGEVLDANDVIRILKGPSAIGVSHAEVPPQKSSNSWLERFKNGNGNGNGQSRHFSISKAQVERAQNVVHSALAELSMDCEYVEDGKVLYDAQNVLGLFSGPPHEATEEIVEMMDNTFAERVPGAGRRKGTYPGRTSDTISVTVMVSNIGRGAPMDKVEWFYKEATRMMGDSRSKRQSREQRWESASRAAGLLPNL
jgi:tubulin-like protein CetZ